MYKKQPLKNFNIWFKWLYRIYTKQKILFDEKKKQHRVYTIRIMPYNDALTFLFLCLQDV